MEQALIIDDHNIVRMVLKDILEKNFSLVYTHEAYCEGEVKSLISKNKYTFVTLDVNMPKSDFVTTLKAIRDFCPIANILVFSMQDELRFGLLSMRLGG